MLGLMIIFASNFILAGECLLEATLVNQDPYPAVPGDYVKLLFQVDGVQDPDCDYVTLELMENYPISFDPGVNNIVSIKGGTHTKDYSSYLMVPFKVRIDKDALEGTNTVEVKFTNTAGGSNKSYQSSTFDIEIEDVRADFELYVKDYDYRTNIMTIEILNIAESDVSALAIEIPSQDGVSVKGSKTNIVGDIDSNEYTTSDFEISLGDGDFNVNIYYTDSNGVRRNTSEKINFDSSYFVGRKADEAKSTPLWMIIVGALIGLGILYWIIKKIISLFNKKRK